MADALHSDKLPTYPAFKDQLKPIASKIIELLQQAKTGKIPEDFMAKMDQVFEVLKTCLETTGLLYFISTQESLESQKPASKRNVEDTQKTLLSETQKNTRLLGNDFLF